MAGRKPMEQDGTGQGDLAGMIVPEEERFRLLVQAVTDYAIYMLDPQGHVASWNPGAERAKGYTADEIIGQHFSRFYTEEDRRSDLPRRALETAAREGRFEGEGWRVRKDGARMWVSVVIDPIRAPDGRLIGFAKIIRDQTERKAAQEELRRSEQQFRLLVQGVADYAIYMLDPEGRVSSWNMGAHRIKGYTAEEIIGQHFSRFYTPEDREAGAPELALAIARREGRFEKEAAVRVRKDGARFWANVVIDAIHDDNGELVGFAKVTRDVTERIEAQKQLEAAREAFYQAQKMESLGQLTGGIAHDFNNLLMAVLSSLEMLRKRLPDDPRLVQLLDNAVQGAERGAALTQRMLAFARRQALSIGPLDVPQLVEGLKGLLEQTLGPTIAIRTQAAGPVRPAQGDANQLELAIINLAVNARDAMPNGGAILIEIAEERVRDRELNGDFVRLAMTDTGEGMDEETLARATEPFFTTKGVGRGSGLGLSMVHGLAEQLSGRLRLRSRKGEGTTVELLLPVASGVGPTATASAPPPGEESARNEAGRLTVLAVDDDVLVLMNTAAMLDDLGHRAIEASNGADALALFDGHPEIDVVVTDYAMPRMTGRDLAAAIAQRRPGTPVVLATGYADLPAGEELDLVRLAKPFGQEELRRALSKAMQRTRPAQ